MILFLVLLAPQAFPTQTRTRALGGVSYFLMDDTNIFFNPAVATDVPGFACAEIGELFGNLRNPTLTTPGEGAANWIGNTSMGMLYHSSLASAGLFFHRATEPEIPDTLFQNMDELIDLQEEHMHLIFDGFAPETWLDFIVARKVTDMISLGLGIEYGRTSDFSSIMTEITDYTRKDTNDAERSEIHGSLGGTVHLLNGLTLEAAGGIGWHRHEDDRVVRFGGSFDSTFTVHEEFDENRVLSKHFSQRAMWELSPSLSLVQFFEMDRGQFDGTLTQESAPGQDDSAVDQTHTLEDNYWRAGFGCNLKPVADCLLVSGVTISGTDWVEEFADTGVVILSREIKTYAHPTLYGGLETRIHKWVTLRASGRQSFQKIRVSESVADPQMGKRNYLEKTLEKEEHPFDLTLGTGIQVGNFAVDLLVNKKIMFMGGFSISGSGDTPFYKISTKYCF